MLKGFKDSIIHGNVIDLAVDVVVGSIFTTIVTTFVGSLLEPLLNTIDGAGVKGLDFETVSGNPSAYLDSAAVITAAINFLLVAAVVYFIIVAPMNRFNEIREAHLGTSAELEVTKADLLTEVRDLLAEQNSRPKTELN